MDVYIENTTSKLVNICKLLIFDKLLLYEIVENCAGTAAS